VISVSTAPGLSSWFSEPNDDDIGISVPYPLFLLDKYLYNVQVFVRKVGELRWHTFLIVSSATISRLTWTKCATGVRLSL
jgi:hypothetical protein